MNARDSKSRIQETVSGVRTPPSPPEIYTFLNTRVIVMTKNVILTGIRPTGRLHIGHLVGALRRNIELQNNGDYDKMYAMIADAQGLTDYFDNPKQVRENVVQVALDMLAVGYDPKKVVLFIQSEIPELTELTFYYMNLVTVARLKRNPTVKNEIAQKEKFSDGIPAGFFTYPVSQTADITAFNANIIPVGADQLPMIEQACEIVQKFNTIYGNTLVMPHAVLPDTESAARLPGTDGNAKMSKSLGNVINLADTPDEIAKKIKGMFTDPEHLLVSDPGHTENNPVFIYLSVFARPEHFAAFCPEYANYEEMAEHYRRGGLGDVKVKKFLNEVIQAELRPIRERRLELARDTASVMEILHDGVIKARGVAADTLARVKKAMLLNYFE